MSDHTHDNFFNHSDWDENGEVAWNEHDWMVYLRANEEEILRFLACYEMEKDGGDALNAVAHKMGWDRDEWAGMPEEGEDNPMNHIENYSIHRHPVYMVTRGLSRRLEAALSTGFSGAQSAQVMPRLWALSQALHAAECAAVDAVQALDVGEYTLATGLFKNALARLNSALGVLHEGLETASRADTLAEINRMIFHLRELWLRVSAECREENRRRQEGEGEGE